MPVALEKREKAHFNAANERRHQKLYLAVYPDISGYLSVFICFFHGGTWKKVVKKYSCVLNIGNRIKRELVLSERSGNRPEDELLSPLLCCNCVPNRCHRYTELRNSRTRRNFATQAGFSKQKQHLYWRGTEETHRRHFKKAKAKYRERFLDFPSRWRGCFRMQRWISTAEWSTEIIHM